MSDAIMLRLAALEARVAALESGGSRAAAPKALGGGEVASDRELDSEWGDPVVKKDPPRWKGDSFAGCTMSQCPPEYLMSLADLYDWMADKDDEQGKTWTKKGDPNAKPVPASKFKRGDAKKARGWANRNKNRHDDDYNAPAPQSPADDSEIPF